MNDKYYIKSLGFYNLTVKQLNFCFEKVVYLYRPCKKFSFFNKITFGYKFVNLTFKNGNDSIILTNNVNDFLCLMAHFFNFLISHYQCCPILNILPVNDELVVSYSEHYCLKRLYISYVSIIFKGEPLVKLVRSEIQHIYHTYKTLSHSGILLE